MGTQTDVYIAYLLSDSAESSEHQSVLASDTAPSEEKHTIRVWQNVVACPRCAWHSVAPLLTKQALDGKIRRLQSRRILC